MSTHRWITFDCFGTLVDWEHGIATSAELVAPGFGQRLATEYSRHEPDVQRERPGSLYRDVMREALARAATALDAGLLGVNADVLGQTIAYWPVFADTRAALSALREQGYRLAFLTNCDRDLIALTQRRLQVPVDLVVTAEDAGSYKPADGHFRRFEHVTGVEHGRWLHVAQSYFHDIRPMHARGVRSIWINRLGEGHDPALATAVLPDLRELPATVQRLDAR